MNRRKINKINIKPFGVFLIILLIAIVFIWIKTYISVADYEKYTAKHVLEEVIDGLKRVQKADFTYKSAVSSEEGTICFNVYRDKEPYGVATLEVLDEKGLLGFDKYKLRSLKGIRSISLLADPTDDITVDNVSLKNLQAAKSNIVLPDLKDLANSDVGKSLKIPTYNLYSFTELFELPTIATQNNELVILNTDDGDLYAHTISKQTEENLTSWARDFVERYTKFIVYDIGYSTIANDIVEGTPLNKILTSSRWDYYYDYDISLDSFDVSDFIKYSDNLLSMRVKYHYHISYKGARQDKRPDLNIYLYKVDGVWKIIEMYTSEWEEE